MNILYYNKQMSIFSFLYKYFFKPIVFRFDPEFIHDHVLYFGKILGQFTITRKISKYIFSFTDSSLEQNILGIHFPNPIGLSAGFDKNAELGDILPAVGFGFAELGSITGEPYRNDI
jgi:dihydroorotate dehydrogenase